MIDYLNYIDDYHGYWNKDGIGSGVSGDTLFGDGNDMTEISSTLAGFGLGLKFTPQIGTAFAFNFNAHLNKLSRFKRFKIKI